MAKMPKPIVAIMVKSSICIACASPRLNPKRGFATKVRAFGGYPQTPAIEVNERSLRLDKIGPFKGSVQFVAIVADCFEEITRFLCGDPCSLEK